MIPPIPSRKEAVSQESFKVPVAVPGGAGEGFRARPGRYGPDLDWSRAIVVMPRHGISVVLLRPMKQNVTRFRRAVYGSIVIPRGLCPDCQEWALIIKGRFACCDRSVTASSTAGAKFERMSEGGKKKQLPSLDERQAILQAQGGRCFYCGTLFGDVARCPRREPLILRATWDHVEPFAWQGNNQTLNFVAACSVCNGIKGSRMFETTDQARYFVWHRRKRKGWETATEIHP